MKLKSGLKQKLLRFFAGGALIAGLFPVSNAFAAAPTSGSCSMLLTQPVPYGATTPFNASYNILAILTFSSAGNTLNAYITTANYTGSGITMGASAPYANVAFYYTVGTNVPDTITATLPISPLLPNGAKLSYNVAQVNGGNTILMQETDYPGSGVCQF